jgi:Nif-specific regulatory protein
MLINHIDYITEQQTTIDRFISTMTDDGIIATSPSMQKVLATVEAIAGADITVLLNGETGTGKNRIAELIHSRSQRSSKPFVIVNCSAVRGELLESELFGHKKGSFTGASNDHDGLFAAAGGGTLLLDEIGELELPLQAKLLRTLETGMIRPIGTTREICVNVRVLCATNRDLTLMVRENLFRADLYYRINQFPITVPPLRERGEDIELLAHLFFNRFKAAYPEKEVVAFHPDALHFIRTHRWPGNIRELSNTIHRAILMTDDRLIRFAPPETAELPATDFDTAIRRFQKNLLQKALLAANGNRETAAKNIGLSRSTFYRYLSQLNIQ